MNIFLIIKLHFISYFVFCNTQSTIYQCKDLENVTSTEEFRTLEDYRQSKLSIKNENNWISIAENLPTLERNMFVRNESNYIRLLNLTRTEIGIIESGAFNELFCVKKLLLQNNNIYNVYNDTFKGLSKVEILNLGFNKLKTIPPDVFGNLPQLVELDLSNNLITNLYTNTFDNLSNMILLNLDHNNIVDFPSNMFEPLQNLQTLILSYNQMSILTTPSLRHLNQLKTFNISYNGIEYIYESMLHKLKNLIVLDISGNALKTIDISALYVSVPSLEKINLNNNQWSCSKLEVIIKEMELHGIGAIINNRTEHENINKNDIGCYEEITTQLPTTSTTIVNNPDNKNDLILQSLHTLKVFVVILIVLIILMSIGFIICKLYYSLFFMRRRGFSFSTNEDPSLPLLNR